MKKILLLLAGCMCFVITVSAQSDSLRATQFIAYNAKGDFVSAQEFFAPILQTKVSPQVLHHLWDKLTLTYGDFESIKKTLEVPLDSIKNVNVHSQFEKAKILFGLTFNAAHKIIGFHINDIEPNKSTKGTKTVGDTAIAVQGGKIYGTLKIPERSRKPLPVVLIIPGSGAVDRDGNATLSLHSNTYKMLADSLAHYGIACFRYDKRGIGESKKLLQNESHLQFQTFVNDAVHIVHFLKKDTIFSNVIIAGHSQGSLIGMMAAQKVKINGFVSLEGAGESIDKVLLYQLSNHKPDQKERLESRIDSLKAGEKVRNGKGLPVFNPKVQPLLTSWMQIEPTREIKKLHIPVLIINGSTDLQVPVKQGRILSNADPSATFAVIKGMNHVLKNAPIDRKENIKTYQDPKRPLNKRLVKKIIVFIHTL